MRAAHQQVEAARFEAPAPGLDNSTFLALVQARRKAMAMLRPAPDALREVAVALREQSEESHPIMRPAAASKPASVSHAQPAPAAKQPQRSKPAVSKAAARAKRLEAQRAEAAERRDQAAKSLAAQQQQLAEARQRLERLNQEKHELVLQLKQVKAAGLHAVGRDISLQRLMSGDAQQGTAAACGSKPDPTLLPTMAFHCRRCSRRAR